MLMPKKTKYRKVHRGSMRGVSRGATTVDFGTYGLAAVEPHWVTAQQIEAMRVTLSRGLRKGGKFFLRVFPSKPITKKPAEVRMGGGKGGPEFWVAVVKRERIVCEIDGFLTEEQARKLLQSVGYKLPMRTKFIMKKD